MKLAEVLRFTPLLQTANEDTFYHLKVEAIKVNERALHIKPSLLRMDSFGNGGFIIDSGTTLTFFTKPLFRAVYMEFKHNVVYPRAPPTAGLRLCYNVSGVSKPRFPRIAIVFAGGAVFRPPPRNYFLSPLNDVRCLGFLSNEGASVLGNLMQQNYYVEYDRHENRLGFAKAHCSAND
ncbi:hypothetical protein KP509_04G083100 [Ceratopteris richardii]|nr:hypothetical protein KP509_04G083100 [Ceratopteris richardii]